MGEYTAKPSRLHAAFAWLTLIAAIISTLIVVGAAQADQLTVFSCHTPDGGAAGDAGWTISRSSDNFLYAGETCSTSGQGAMSLEVGANPVGYTSSSEIDWVDEDPVWATTAKYKIVAYGNYSAGGNAEYQIGMGQTYIGTANELAQGVYDLRDLGNGQWGASTIEKTPSETTRALRINASCDGEWGRCSANTQIAWIDLASVTNVLNDPTYPSVSGISGNLLSAAPLQGEAEAIFTAADKGPGVYSAWIEVDGKAESPVLLDSNNGSCVNLGQTTDGTRSFDSPDPCAETVSGAVSLDTPVLHDGKHSVKILVDDASGNTTVAYTGTIETHNAPTVTSAPAISGTASVGSTLTATPADFVTVEGAGSLSAITGQWLRCSDAAGTHCAAIAGATGNTYSPASSDVGYYLLYTSSISNRDGSTTSDSAPTVAVTEPASEVSGYGSQGNPGGSSANGGLLGGVGGSGGASGSSALTVNITTGSGLLGSDTPWKINLRITPRTAWRGSTIHFTGNVSDSPTTLVAGKQVYLQARIVTGYRIGHGARKRVVYGEWKTFKATKTGAAGVYKTAHTFHFRGPCTYQFRALAPPERGYENTEGSSSTVTLFERAAPQSKKRSR